MKHSPPTPRPSATLLLLRESESGAGFETLMVGRHREMAFGDLYAFPGGVVEEQDFGLAKRCAEISASLANQWLNVSDSGLAYWVTAIRETFEETGLLLAVDRSGSPMDADTVGQMHDEMTAGRTFEDLCNDRDLTFPLSAIHYISHWITPEVRAKRFDTRFFLAAQPEGQELRFAEAEVTDGLWVSPQDVLSGSRDHQVPVAFPTQSHLEFLAQHDTLAEALDWGYRQARDRVEPILPVVRRKGRPILPGEPGYPKGKEK